MLTGSRAIYEAFHQSVQGLRESVGDVAGGRKSMKSTIPRVSQHLAAIGTLQNRLPEPIVGAFHNHLADDKVIRPETLAAADFDEQKFVQ